MKRPPNPGKILKMLGLSSRSSKAGLPPGTLVHVGEQCTPETSIYLIDFMGDHIADHAVSSANDCVDIASSDSTTWINVDGLSNTSVIEEFGKLLHLHPLTMEDILSTHQRPKVEAFDKYLYIVLRMLSFDKASRRIVGEQVSLVLGDNFVISFQEQPGDVFDAIRERIRASKGRIRQQKADYLLYALMDAVVDSYFSILECMGDELESLEDSIIDQDENALRNIHDLRGELIFLRKSIWPLREVIGSIERGVSSRIQDSTLVFLRDLHDHTAQVIDTIETSRDILSALTDLHVSTMGNRMNEVMKTLAVIATIFIPLTFIAGIYGMNFEIMPELKLPYAYPAVLSIMLLLAVSMTAYFKRKHWF